MQTRPLSTWAWLKALACFLAIANAAAASSSTNEYQITSGRYYACCGIAGPINRQLPDSEQSTVLLIINHDNQRARMLILGTDRSIMDQFENGRVFPGYIEFGMAFPPGFPGGPTGLHYIVSNNAAGLRINGVREEPMIGADIFTHFSHSNVVATPLHLSPPQLTIHVSEVQICWPSILGQTYLVQYSPAPTDSGWAPLGDLVTGNGTTTCVSDRVTPAQRNRSYRVLMIPNPQQASAPE